MKIVLFKSRVVLCSTFFALSLWCSDKDAQTHLSNSADHPEAPTASCEEKNQSWSGPLMLQPTDLVALSETMDAGARLQLLDALERENTGTRLPQEKVNGFVRKHRQSIVAFNKEDPRLAAMALAASEAAFWAEHAQVMEDKK